MLGLLLKEIELYIEAYTTNKIIEALKEAEIGWSLELPDLPNFQITAFGNEKDKGVDGYGYWASLIYDTKDLPLVIKALKHRKDEHGDSK